MDSKLGIVAAGIVSLAVHGAVGGGLLTVEHVAQKEPRPTVIRVIKKRPAKRAKPVQAAAPTETKPKKQRPPRRIRRVAAAAPPEQRTKQAPRANVKPVFGVSMNATVSGVGVGVAVQVGNTLVIAPKKTKQLEPRDGRPRAGPVNERAAAGPSYKLTAMPRPVKLVKAKYPEKARAAGIEGDTQLKLHIDAQGRVTKVAVLQGIGHGLDQLAVAAARGFVFEPARVGNRAVPTVIPFTYRWDIEE